MESSLGPLFVLPCPEEKGPCAHSEPALAEGLSKSYSEEDISSIFLDPFCLHLFKKPNVISNIWSLPSKGRGNLEDINPLPKVFYWEYHPAVEYPLGTSFSHFLSMTKYL